MLELNTSVSIDLRPIDTALAVTFAEPAVKPVADAAAEAAIIEEFKADYEEFFVLRRKFVLTNREYSDIFSNDVTPYSGIDQNDTMAVASLVTLYEVGPALHNAVNKLKNKFGEYRSIPFIKEKLDAIEDEMLWIPEADLTKNAVWRLLGNMRRRRNGTAHALFYKPCVVRALDFWIARKDDGILSDAGDMKRALKIRAKIAAALAAR